MTTGRDRWPVDDDAFDRTLQTLHADAVAHVSPRTRAQLLQRLRAAMASSVPVAHDRWRLATAAALAAVLVSVAYVDTIRWQPREAPAIAAADTAQPDVLAVIDEPPDLYLWLASDDARQFANE
jgi:anti-sigma-K factor RskA